MEGKTHTLLTAYQGTKMGITGYGLWDPEGMDSVWGGKAG